MFDDNITMQMKSNMAQIMLEAKNWERLYEENKPKGYIMNQNDFFLTNIEFLSFLVPGTKISSLHFLLTSRSRSVF